MRHYAHNIGDYAAATRHLSFVEDAAYRRLLDRYYQEEKPLPSDVTTCCRLVAARSKEERQAVQDVLTEFFVLESDGWHQKRADREIAGFLRKAEVARENGRTGGRPKTKREPKNKPDDNPQITQPVSAGLPSEKLPTTHYPLPISSEPNGSGGKPPPTGKDLIFGEWLAWLIERTERPRKDCASQLGKWRKLFGDDDALIAALSRAKAGAIQEPMAWMEEAAKVHRAGAGLPPPKTPEEARAQLAADPNWSGVMI